MTTPTYDEVVPPEDTGAWPWPLYELTLAVAAARQPDDIYEAALSCLRQSLGITRASVLLFDREGVMRFKAWRGLSPEYRAAVDGHSPWTLATTDAEPVLVADVRMDPALEALRPTIEREGIRALAFIPLQMGTRLLGKFMLYRDEPHEFTHAEVMTARTIAAHVAFALDQREHRESNERARYVVESLGVALYTTDANGVITFYNEEAAALWGRRPEVGVDTWHGAAQLFRPDGRPLPFEQCPLALALSERRIVRGHELIMERADGSRIDFIPYPTPILDSDGTLLGAVNVLVDITSRKQAERALREREGVLAATLSDREALLRERDDTIALAEHIHLQLASLIEASGALIATEHETDAVRSILETERQLLGADAYAMWRYVDSSKQWEITLADGLSRAYLEGSAIPNSDQRQLMVELIVEDVTQEPELAALAPRYKAEGIASMFVCPMRLGDHAHGTVTFYYRSAHRFSDIEVRVGRALANLASASLSAARLLEANEVARAALGAANEDLRSANAAKDEFLSLVSHELKTPLTTIRGNASVLFRHKDKLDAESRNGALADIVADSERLHRIIENLLLLARAEQGERLETEPLLVVRVVEKVVQRHRQHHPERPIEVIQQGDPRPVEFSEASLEQVMENLISNAEKYSPPTEPILIRVERVPHEVRLSVQDHGVGLGSLEVGRLFDRFYRSDGARAQAEGLGIGLAVCKRLVEAQGGSIWASNRAGGGAEFGFALPVAHEDADAAADDA